MLRRITFVVVLVTALIGFAGLPVAAQSGRTFYIDYASGSNSNAGTKASPWKTHPYMQTGASCTGSGSAPSYSHQAGDQFIFKGGVSWPSSCFVMNIAQGGSSDSVHDYYGVDSSWPSSGWTRPLFNMGGNHAANERVIQVSASNLTVDNIEIKGQLIDLSQANSDGYCASGVSIPFGPSNVLISNMYIHDWLAGTNGGVIGHGMGGICSTVMDSNWRNQKNIVVDHAEISDVANTLNGVSHPFGGCFRNVSVRYSKCHDVGDGIVSHGFVHDNEFYNLTIAEEDYGTGIHTNIIEGDNYDGDGPIFNNLIHDNFARVNIFEQPSANIYNNVMWNNVWNAAILIRGYPTSGTAPLTNVTNIYNNTLECYNNHQGGSSTACVSVVQISGQPSVPTLNLRNNVFITNNSSPYGGNLISGVIGNNYQYTSLSAANSQGLTFSNFLAPTSASTNMIGKGANLGGICGSMDSEQQVAFAALCSDTSGAPWYGGSYVTRGSTWDLGAYAQSSTQQPSASKPAPPSNLAAIVQ